MWRDDGTYDRKKKREEDDRTSGSRRGDERNYGRKEEGGDEGPTVEKEMGKIRGQEKKKNPRRFMRM